MLKFAEFSTSYCYTNKQVYCFV